MNDAASEKRFNKNPLLLKILGMGASYFVKTPGWLKKIYPKRVWDIRTIEKVLYLSFDDGPHPIATPFVLDQLKKYNSKATFFCIGKNVEAWPEIYKRIIDEGHRVGNHTYHHLNGWETNNDAYLHDIAEAGKFINTDLFRPPYGRIRSSQAKRISDAMKNKSSKIIMWSVLSGDFDEFVTKEKCLRNVTANTKGGSIVVFHDSEKAYPMLKHVLPQVLDFFSEKGYLFEQL